MPKSALTRFRVAAWIVGTMLLALTAGMVLKYGFDDARLVESIGMLHGFLYMVYLVLAADLGRRAGWSLRYTVLIMLAGTVPFLSFVAERAATRKVRGMVAEQPQPVGGAAR